MIRIGLVLLLAVATPLSAKESLGVFENWGAFRDEAGPRCYAIAVSRGTSGQQAYATVTTWPRHNIRGQTHFRLSREARPGSAVTLRIGRERFGLTGSGTNAWGANRRMDAAILAALRSANRLSVNGIDTGGRRFSDSYALNGVASAMDAATVACARRR